MSQLQTGGNISRKGVFGCLCKAESDPTQVDRRNFEDSLAPVVTRFTCPRIYIHSCFASPRHRSMPDPHPNPCSTTLCPDPAGRRTLVMFSCSRPDREGRTSSAGFAPCLQQIHHQHMMSSASQKSEEFDLIEMGASALIELAMGGFSSPIPQDDTQSAVEIAPLAKSKPSLPIGAVPSAPRQARASISREVPPQCTRHIAHEQFLASGIPPVHNTFS